jgi:hypothetical protein
MKAADPAAQVKVRHVSRAFLVFCGSQREFSLVAAVKAPGFGAGAGKAGMAVVALD